MKRKLHREKLQVGGNSLDHNMGGSRDLDRERGLVLILLIIFGISVIYTEMCASATPLIF